MIKISFGLVLAIRLHFNFLRKQNHKRQENNWLFSCLFSPRSQGAGICKVFIRHIPTCTSSYSLGNQGVGIYIFFLTKYPCSYLITPENHWFSAIFFLFCFVLGYICINSREIPKLHS